MPPRRGLKIIEERNYYENREYHVAFDFEDAKGNKYTEITIYHDDDGRKKKERFTMRDGERDGTVEFWDRRGTRLERYEVKHNKQCGKYESWYDSGKKRFIRHYDDDVAHGKCESWHSNGTKMKTTHYHKGVLHGRQQWWNEDGKKSTDVNYYRGMLHGKYEHWYTNGERESLVFHNHNLIHGECKRWNMDGTIRVHEMYVMDIPRKYALKMLYYLRRLKWMRLSRMVKTEAFVRWWYSPQNVGGRLSKRSITTMLGEVDGEVEERESKRRRTE